MACPEMDLRHGLGDVATGYVTEYNNEGACQYFFTHTQKLLYKTGPTAITLKQRLLAKPTAAWRVVYSGQVGALNEIIIDELARSLGKDEFEFRMETLDSPTGTGPCWRRRAEEAQWGQKLPAGVAQGIGMHDEYKSIAAYIMEIDTRGKEPRMTACTIAVDNGYCVNPEGTEVQPARPGPRRLRPRVPGRPPRRQRGHPGVELPRLQVDPDVRLGAGDERPHPAELQRPPGGIGELGVPAAAGAAANAWARATGKQPRNFPLNEYGA